MIDKLLGISDKSILKKSSYYGYLFGAIFGIILIVFGVIIFIFKTTNTYKDIVVYNKNSIEYINSLAKMILDDKLFKISKIFKINFELIDNILSSYGWVAIFFGMLMISHYFLFKKLREKQIELNKILHNSNK